MRIVSLLPSITEIVCALGRKEQLVGISHECDYPPGIRSLPSCTEPKFEPDGSSYRIDRQIRSILQEGLSVYRVDADRLRTLKPDVILTQDHCEVCAASLPEVKKAAEACLNDDVRILSVAPTDLQEIYESIRQIADTLNAEQEGKKLNRRIRRQLETIREQASSGETPTVATVEWIDPLMGSGNWIPELVRYAQGKNLLSAAGEHSSSLAWAEVRGADPDYLMVMPCGYGIDQTLEEIDTLMEQPGWNDLRAVRDKNVYILDGNQYFNRPGPRLTDSAAILAEILHPDPFDSEYEGRGWINLYDRVEATR